MKKRQCVLSVVRHIPLPHVLLHLELQGAVQGVGMRPFVKNLATEMGLTGYIENTIQGVTIEVEGLKEELKLFERRLHDELPPLALITACTSTDFGPCGYGPFTIRTSSVEGDCVAAMLPDAATCPDCLREMNDPESRWYRYPFLSCTHCGPRATFMRGFPYDRAKTSMEKFPMCPDCRAEYNNSANRRYHAQSIACPVCGPQLALWNRLGAVVAERDDALKAAIGALKWGKIVAVQGLGGFHLMVDATNQDAVVRLRERKHRYEKPFALMYSSIERIEEHCELSATSVRHLTSSAAPIVLLARKEEGLFREYPAEAVVGDMNPYFGIMLPYTPLQHLLLQGMDRPLVATSGNLSEEPMIIDRDEAVLRLRDIADLFLVNDRPIVRPMDDSVAYPEVCGTPLVLRRGRGFAPFPMQVPESEVCILAVGPHQKNTVALKLPGSNVVVSQHNGNLDTRSSEANFRTTIDDLLTLYGVTPDIVACDMHPNYYSTEWAQGCGAQLAYVQHHEAHVLAVAGEHSLTGGYLGVAMDGTGLGHDGTIWGGEFFAVTDDAIERIAHLKQFRLLGGDAVAREPYRSALGVLHAVYGPSFRETCADLPPVIATTDEDIDLFAHMLEYGDSSPLCSSTGRLFDAVASILGLRHRCGYEGQAAMELEWCAMRACDEVPYGLPTISLVSHAHAPIELCFDDVIRTLCNAVREQIPVAELALYFHTALASAMVQVAVVSGHDRVVLSGGCFQNKLLLETTVRLLQKKKKTAYVASRLPPNDGAVAFGQVCSVLRNKEKKR